MSPPAGDSAARKSRRAHPLDYILPSNEEDEMRDRSARDRASDKWSDPNHWSKHPLVRYAATFILGGVVVLASNLPAAFARVFGSGREVEGFLRDHAAMKLEVAKIPEIEAVKRELDAVKRDTAKIPEMEREVRRMSDTLIRIEALALPPSAGKGTPRGHLQFTPPVLPLSAPEEAR